MVSLASQLSPQASSDSMRCRPIPDRRAAGSTEEHQRLRAPPAALNQPDRLPIELSDQPGTAAAVRRLAGAALPLALGASLDLRDGLTECLRCIGDAPEAQLAQDGAVLRRDATDADGRHLSHGHTVPAAAGRAVGPATYQEPGPSSGWVVAILASTTVRPAQDENVPTTATCWLRPAVFGVSVTAREGRAVQRTWSPASRHVGFGSETRQRCLSQLLRPGRCLCAKTPDSFVNRANGRRDLPSCGGWAPGRAAGSPTRWPRRRWPDRRARRRRRYR
jgi:hypothetical protein